MSQRTMVKISAEETTFSMKTFSRAGRSSQRFIFLKKELDMLEEKGHIIVSDIHSFAKMQLYKMDSGMEIIQITFTWLQGTGNNRVSGMEETVRLPYEQLKECMAASEVQNGVYQKLLSIEENRKPKILFRSRQNLKSVVQKKTVRRKLGKFLDRQFNWPGAREICISDDFCPYSFFFTEYRRNGKGICGGIILHGQENLATAYYGMHT